MYDIEGPEQNTTGKIVLAVMLFIVLPIILFFIGMIFNWGGWAFAALIPPLIALIVVTPVVKVLLTVLTCVAWILMFFMATITRSK